MRHLLPALLLACLAACASPSATGGAADSTDKADSGSSADVDAGTSADAGADAGTTADAGAAADAGTSGDAGTSVDAGTQADAGAADAGHGQDSDGGADAGSTDGGPTAGLDAGPGWVVAHEETFETLSMPAGTFVTDPVPDDGPFADHGLFFQKQGVVPPKAYRATVPFGASSWLTAESYTRSTSRAFSELASVVVDPADPTNHVLKIASPAHTDATVVRPSAPLPLKYRVSVRVGFADFGDGKPKPGLNGYKAAATAEPWSSADATAQNGFYWLAILDSQPRPHNNTWIHQHRKVVMDSDNNTPPWMEIYDGAGFKVSGEHPLMIIALDGAGQGTDLTGKPFLSYSNGAWQPSGAIRAVDSYLPGEWYRATIERNGDVFTFEVSGKFQYGGQQTYRASIDAAANCVFHYNRPGESARGRCIDETSPASLGPGYPSWPASGGWADWFQLGDPHNNYYEGSVLYDDLRLEVWRD